MANTRIDEYKRTIGAIEADEAFKSRTRELLMQTLAEQEKAPPEQAGTGQAGTGEAAEAPVKGNTLRPNFRRWLGPGVAAAAVVLVAVVALRAGLFTSVGEDLTADGMAEAAMPYEAALDTADDEMAVYDAVNGESALMAELPEAAAGYFDTTAATGDILRGALPTLTLGRLESLDSGYQGISLYGFGEYSGLLLGETGAPATLPVYRNGLLGASPGGAPAASDQQTLLEGVGRDVAENLHLNVTGVMYLSDGADPYVILQADGATVTVYNELYTEVLFDSPVALGDTPPADTAAGWRALAGQALTLYNGLFTGMENPETEVIFERGQTGEAAWYAKVFDAGSSAAEQVQSRSLRYAELAFDGSGRLQGLYLYRYSEGAPLGEYPTITLEEATEALAAGHSLTTVPYAFPGEEMIAGVDLVYLATGGEDCFIPFYLFYVELPDGLGLPEEADEGLVSFGMWYVPAISGEYLYDADGLPFFG